MTLSTIDPVPAFVAIDLQAGIVGRPMAPRPGPEVVAACNRLAAAFHRKGWPVVWVNVSGAAPGRTDARAGGRAPAFAEGWDLLVPELDIDPADHRVTKWNVGAFHGTGLDRLLRRAGVTQVMLAGIATASGVESTARAAQDIGYNVVLVEDAMADMSAEAHAAAVTGTFPRMGEVTTVAAVLEKIG